MIYLDAIGFEKNMNNSIFIYYFYNFHFLNLFFIKSVYLHFYIFVSRYTEEF